MEAQAKYETIEIAPLGIIEITEANLALMKKQVLKIPAMPENKEQYNSSRDMHIQAKKVLPLIEQRRKEIKAPHLEKCREIDATAKTAKAMIEPIIEMAGDRRGAWEAEIDAQKETERKTEQARLDGIMESIEDLKSMISEATAYGITSGDLKGRIFKIASYPMTEELFQEHLPTAAKIQADGLTSIKQILENRVKYEADQAKLEAQQKAQAEVQAKIDAENKAEADRLAKIAADQKAETARIKAEQESKDKKIREAQEAEARKLAKERAEFEAEKKAMAQAEAERIEAARIAERDRLWGEALPIHIWEYVYPVALEMDTEHDQVRREAMDAQAKRDMDIIKNRNAVDSMTRNVIDVIGFGGEGIDIPEVKKAVEVFKFTVNEAIKSMNRVLAEVK